MQSIPEDDFRFLWLWWVPAGSATVELVCQIWRSSRLNEDKRVDMKRTFTLRQITTARKITYGRSDLQPRKRSVESPTQENGVVERRSAVSLETQK
jgi:hypothetical protein